MLMRFWSEISRIFLCMFWGLINLRLKNVYSILFIFNMFNAIWQPVNPVLYFLWVRIDLPVGHTMESLSSSSTGHAISTDIPDFFSPPLPIVHCFRKVFRTASRIDTELLYVGSSGSSCLCTSLWRSLQEYITYELVPTSPTVFCMSGSSNFDSFFDGWSVTEQLLLCSIPKIYHDPSGGGVVSH